MKLYVVTVEEDDGWQTEHTTVGVKTNLADALKLMKEEEEKFKDRNDWEHEAHNFQIAIRDNYVFYDCNGDWWFKVKYEIIEESWC